MSAPLALPSASQSAPVAISPSPAADRFVGFEGEGEVVDRDARSLRGADLLVDGVVDSNRDARSLHGEDGVVALEIVAECDGEFERQDSNIQISDTADSSAPPI